METIERHGRLDRQVEYGGCCMRPRPAQPRVGPGKQRKCIKIAQPPVSKPAKRRRNVTVLTRVVLVQIRNSNRESGEAVVLKGKTHRAKHSSRRSKTFGDSRRNVVKLQLDLVNGVVGLAYP